MASYANGNCDIAALMSQQRLLRQQEQQLKAEVLRLSRSKPFAMPQDRPLPPPPPQQPIERRVNRAAASYRGGQDGDVGTFEGGPGGFSSSWRWSERREDGEAGGMAAALARRQEELQQQQRERRQQIVQQQRFMQWPTPCVDSMEGLPRDGHDGSPYTFGPSPQETFQGLSRFPRSATVSVTWGEGAKGASRAEKRQLTRISPCSLPAAGMPSGRIRRSGEDGYPTRQRRRQVLPDYATAASSPLLHATDAWPLQVAPRDAVLNPLSCAYAAAVGDLGSQGPSGICVPSTLPPSLHSQPEVVTLLNPMPTPLEKNSKEVSLHAAGLPSQRLARHGANAPLSPPLPEQQQEKQIRKQAEQQPFTRQRVEFSAGVAAGKPSSELGCDIWGFRQSLRSPDELKTSVGRQSVHTRAATPSITPATPTLFADGAADGAAAAAAATVSDDEETLKQIGVSASPRELLFFRKQPGGRGVQRRANSRRSRSSNPSGAAKTAKAASPLSRGGCGGGGHLAPDPGVWTVPSWMRAYGVSGSPSPLNAEREDGRQQFRLPPPGYSSAVESQHPQMQPVNCLEDPCISHCAQDGGELLCGCRCCRLRAEHAQDPGVNPAVDHLCCCCPCCSWSRAEAGVPPVDSNGGYRAEEAKSEKGDAAVAATAAAAAPTGRCSRCGKRSAEVASTLHASQHGVPLSLPLDDRLPVEQAASLCPACAAFLQCERDTREAAPIPAPGAAARAEGSSLVNEHYLASSSALQTSARHSDQRNIHREAAKAAAAKEEQGELRAAVVDTSARNKSSNSSSSSFKQVSGGDSSSQRRRSAAAETKSDPNVWLSAARQLCSSSEGPPEPNMVWENPRVVSKICQYLSLSKLLLIRRCNKTLLQSAQYRMRFVLYNSLFLLMHKAEAGAAAAHPQLTKEAQRCPLSAEALVQLLGLDEKEVEEVSSGNLPPACPPEAATPRMHDVAAVLLKSLAEVKVATEAKALKTEDPKGQLISRKQPMRQAAPPSAAKKDASKQNVVTRPEVKQQQQQQLIQEHQQQQLLQKQLLDAHMAKQHAQEEAYLKMMRAQIDRPVNFGYDEAAGPAVSPCTLPFEQSTAGSPEPATFRRVRHAFLKLWNYDDEAFRQALVRATTASYPPWLFDVSALLLRAVFQLCCNSLSAPPLKDLIPLFSPKRKPSSKAEVPCRSDSYLWAKMARISGYAMHLISDQAWPPLRDPIVRLVAQPFISPNVLTRGARVDTQTLYDAAAAGVAVTPLLLRPAVVDSLEGKMSKVSPDFIVEFLAYGKQQQIIHSSGHPRSLHAGIRQFKASSELILMMDLYEWLASVLTHMQNTEISATMRASTAGVRVPPPNENKGVMQKTGTGTRKARSPVKIQAASKERNISRQHLLPSSSAATVERPRTCSAKMQKGAIGPTDAKVLRDLIEEQSVILREVCQLLKAIKTQGARSSG